MRRTMPLAASVLLAGCAHLNTVSHESLPPGRNVPVPIPAMERQVLNAVDAGEGDAEVRELRHRLATNPDDLKARLELANRYQKQGYPELAIEHLRFAAVRTPHLSEVSIRLAKALHAAGEEQLAVDELAKFCKRDPLPPAELISLLGVYEDDLGLYAQAEAHHRTAVDLAPKRDSMWNNLGYNLLLQGKAEQAAADFRRAVALNPRSEIARNNLGTALALSPGGDLKEAVLQWQAVSGPATAHSNLASVLIEQKRYAEAKRELEVALGFERNHVAALSNLALLSELEGSQAAVSLPARQTAWQRLVIGIRRALAGKPETDRTDAGTVPVESATRQD